MLDWDAASGGHHAERLDQVRSLLRLRATQIVPRLAGMRGGEATHEIVGEHGLRVTWKTADGALVLLANFGPSAIVLDGTASGPHRVIYESASGLATGAAQSEIAPWSVLFLVREADAS